MINSFFTYSIVILIQIISAADWYSENDNPWANNTSARSSALGGVCLENFDELSKPNQLEESDGIRIFSSSIYDNSIKYNNIFYTKKIDDFNIFGNQIKSIRIGFLNRKIDNILNTTDIWSDEFSPPSTPDDLNDGSIHYYSHNDFSGSIFIPLVNNIGQFSLNLRPGFSKVGSDSFKALNIDISFLYLLNNEFFIGSTINNFFSFRKWSNGTNERFFPYISLLLNYNFKNLKSFLKIHNLSNFDMSNNVGIGLEYLVYKDLYIRGGYGNQHSSIGLGMHLYNMIFDYTYLNHEYLGNSSQISIALRVK